MAIGARSDGTDVAPLPAAREALAAAAQRTDQHLQVLSAQQRKAVASVEQPTRFQMVHLIREQWSHQRKAEVRLFSLSLSVFLL